MADQKKWFKVWTSLLIDMDHVSNADLGAWVRLGCRIALVGDSGTVRFEQGWEHLAKFLKCSINDAQDTLKRVHGIVIEESKTVHGELSVSFKKWYEYQEDSTYKERLKRTRDKRRGEEKRGEEIRREEEEPPNSDTISVKDFVDSWNQNLIDKLPQVDWPISQSRRTKIKARLREHPDVDFWETVLGNILNSPFLLGSHNGKGGHENWQCTLDFLIANDTNCVKIKEGQYAKNDR